MPNKIVTALQEQLKRKTLLLVNEERKRVASLIFENLDEAKKLTAGSLWKGLGGKPKDGKKPVTAKDLINTGKKPSWVKEGEVVEAAPAPAPLKPPMQATPPTAPKEKKKPAGNAKWNDDTRMPWPADYGKSSYRSGGGSALSHDYKKSGHGVDESEIFEDESHNTSAYGYKEHPLHKQFQKAGFHLDWSNHDDDGNNMHVYKKGNTAQHDNEKGEQKANHFTITSHHHDQNAFKPNWKEVHTPKGHQFGRDAFKETSGKGFPSLKQHLEGHKGKKEVTEDITPKPFDKNQLQGITRNHDSEHETNHPFHATLAKHGFNYDYTGSQGEHHYKHPNAHAIVSKNPYQNNKPMYSVTKHTGKGKTTGRIHHGGFGATKTGHSTAELENHIQKMKLKGE